MNDREIQEELMYRMRSTIASFQTLSNNQTYSVLLKQRLNQKRKPRLLNTLVLLPYTSTPGTQKFSPGQRELLKYTHKLRLLFLEATVLSISRYFPRIVITTSNQYDYETVAGLRLPVWRIINLESEVNTVGRSSFLPSASLLHIYEKFVNLSNPISSGQIFSDEELVWRGVRYIYYSEMDQILYATRSSLLTTFTTLDKLNGSAIFVPHRMNVSG